LHSSGERRVTCRFIYLGDFLEVLLELITMDQPGSASADVNVDVEKSPAVFVVQALKEPAPPVKDFTPAGILALAKSFDPTFEVPRPRSRSQ